MIKSPHLRASIKMALLVTAIAVIGVAMMGIAFSLNYVYLTYGGEGIAKLISSIVCVWAGTKVYFLMLDEEKRKDRENDL